MQNQLYKFKKKKKQCFLGYREKYHILGREIQDGLFFPQPNMGCMYFFVVVHILFFYYFVLVGKRNT